MRRSAVVVGLALAALLLLAPGTAEAQCAMCRTALVGNGLLAAAFRRAVWFLLAAPFAFVGIVALLIVRERGRAAGESVREMPRGADPSRVPEIGATSPADLEDRR